MIKRGDPYRLFWEFQGKKKINFQNIKLIFNRIFYKESKQFRFARISRKNYFLNPLFEGNMIQRGDPNLLFWEFQKKKKIFIFKILNSFLIVYFIKSPKSLLSLEYLEKTYFLNPLFEGKIIQRGDPYLLFWEFEEKKKF